MLVINLGGSKKGGTVWQLSDVDFAFRQLLLVPPSSCRSLILLNCDPHYHLSPLHHSFIHSSLQCLKKHIYCQSCLGLLHSCLPTDCSSTWYIQELIWKLEMFCCIPSTSRILAALVRQLLIESHSQLVKY